MKKMVIVLVAFFCFGSNAFAAGKNCTYKGDVYAPGASTKIDDCNWCTCINGSMVCSLKKCLKKPKKPVKRAKRSCVVTSCHVKNGKRICYKIARMVPHGGKVYPEDKCSDCVCNDGTVVCKRTAKCDKMPSCKFKYKNKQGKTQTITIKHGVKLPTAEDCNRCFCHKGQFICPKNECLPTCMQRYVDEQAKEKKKQKK